MHSPLPDLPDLPVLALLATQGLGANAARELPAQAFGNHREVGEDVNREVGEIGEIVNGEEQPIPLPDLPDLPDLPVLALLALLALLPGLSTQ